MKKETQTTSASPMASSCAATASVPEMEGDVALRMARYNVVWDSPSQDATGVMPIGNGDIAAGVYALKDGDLYLLLAKNDAYTYMGDLWKTGRVRIALSPNPFAAGKPFRQTLDLSTGSILIEADGVLLRIWADAHHPTFHIGIESPHEVAISARPDLWKRIDHTPFNIVDGYTVVSGGERGSPPPQDVILERNGKNLWYFAVGDQSVYSDDLKHYGVQEMASRFPDPFRFNTFGNLLESPQLEGNDGRLTGHGRSFDIRIHALTMQTPEPSEWVSAIERQAQRAIDLQHDWKAHCDWWNSFWDRSWMIVTDNTQPAETRERLHGEASASGRREESDGGALVAQSYNVFRFLMACQSRGRVQTKFNGGLFTQQLRDGDSHMQEHGTRQADGSWLSHEDDRLWGRRFTFQNQRLLYWPLLASGDTDLMAPFFAYYSNLLEMRTAITKAWFGHEGAYFRENIEPTGAEWDTMADGQPPSGAFPPRTKPGETYAGWYHDYYFLSGLEIALMMIEYVAYTSDTTFRDRTLVPFAREILRFYEQHYPRAADGKIRIEPAQVLETWWLAVNPAPEVAGLRYCLDRLLSAEVGTTEDRARWTKFRAEIPEIPMRTIDGRIAIAPAEKWDKCRNSENGELYPVFPFRCFGIGFGSGDVAEWTLRNLACKDSLKCRCWAQDEIQWAYAGNAAQARDGLVARFRIASTQCRFPLYGSEGPDSCPDFDHFGSGSIALQRMAVQEENGKILLLPAWPANWDADFKLHLTHGGVITATVKQGRMLTWDIQPASRKKDVIVCEPQVR